MVAIDALGFPLSNTLILLASGLCATAAHDSFLRCEYKVNLLKTLCYLACSIILGILFLSFQFIEYINAPFNIADGIYPSIFFSLTGLHCSHVLAGLISLLVVFLNLNNYFYTKHRHIGLLTSVIYWHFVDFI